MGTIAQNQNMPGNHTALHFPQLAQDGTCGKKVHRPHTTSEVRCGEGRDAKVHLYYPCLADVCARRFWSIESRLIHMEKSHP